ncbi:MAG TPA: O-antigen ligase family protein [bacterium]|jgi:O-antigen ligase|nr:O-antigen ligase family protein [bacterium]
MENKLSYSRPLFWILLAFAATSVASIALQNLVWVAVALFLFAHCKDKRKIEWPAGLFPVATLIFLLTFFLGGLVGTDPANSFHTLHKYLTFLLVFLVGAMALRPEDIRKILVFFTYGAAFCALHGIWNHFWNHQDRIDSFSGDKMVFGGMLMVSLLLQISHLIKSPKNLWLWTALILIAVGLFLTQTRGAWLGFLVGFAFLGSRLNRKWLLVGFLLAGFSFFFLPQEVKDRLKNMTHIWVTYDSQHHLHAASESRILIWLTGWEIIKDHPWGVGQGNVSELFPQYNHSVLAQFEPTVPHLHDNFLQILAQNGWLGLMAYLFWIFSYYWETTGRMAPADGNRELHWTFLCVFTSILVWGLSEYTFSHQFMNVQFFLLGLQAGLWKSQPIPPAA